MISRSSLLEQYQAGMINDTHLVVESLNLVDPENPGLVLNSLPEDILMRVLRFSKEFRQGRMITNYGSLPAIDQVRAAQHWIEETLRQKADKTA